MALAHPCRSNLTAATELANLPDAVGGYEHLKLNRIGAYRNALEQGLLEFCQ